MGIIPFLLKAAQPSVTVAAGLFCRCFRVNIQLVCMHIFCAVQHIGRLTDGSIFDTT